jgi:hypothetical protein
MMKIKKPKSAMKHKQNRKGTAQRRETGLPANTIRARSGGVHGLAGRRCSSVNRIEEKIKKCHKCQNPCNSGLVKVSPALRRGEAPAEPFGGGCSRNPIFKPCSQQFWMKLGQQIVGLLFSIIAVIIWMMESEL